MHLTNLAPFYLATANPGSACPNTDWLAASNDICTKRSMAHFKLFAV